jgi:hypothetical protein
MKGQIPGKYYLLLLFDFLLVVTDIVIYLSTSFGLSSGGCLVILQDLRNYTIGFHIVCMCAMIYVGSAFEPLAF